MAPATAPSEIAETRPAPKRHLPWKLPLVLLVLLALAALLWHLRGRITFDEQTLVLQLRAVSLPEILLALALTYVGYWLRAWRWSVLIAPVCSTSTPKLFPAQLIGFTVVALFGRVADLARPYLIARRTQTPVATQLAIYSVERAFDLAAAAILFSVTLAVSPRNIPHHEAFTRAGALSLAGTLFVVVIALALRFSGGLLASITARLLRPLSPGLSASASARILDLRDGFRTVSSLREFLTALALSLVMWTVIAFVYVESTHAFRASPPLATLSFASIMLLLATGLGGSLLQLPVLGWFTQIAVFAAALHAFFSVPLETATACGAVLLVTTTLCVIPAGLLAARIQGIALRDAAHTTPT
jgi:uncharacterized membrane protein YbhN (UPF0104 family)